MVLLVDDNVLLDVLQDRQEFYDDSFHVWELCRKGQCEGYISALTFADIVYVMRKEVKYNEIDELLDTVAKVFRFAALTMQDLSNAANMKWRDFEDAVQSSTASRIHADYIITRNTKDFQDSPIPAITPEEYFTNIFTPEQ